MAFPDFAVLDDFSRVDGGLGSAWTGGFGGGTGTLSIVTNRVALTAGSSGDFRWNSGNTSSANCQVYCDMPVAPDSTSNIVLVVARVNTFGATWNGYGIYLIPTSIGGDTCTILLAKFIAGGNTTLNSAASVQTSTIQGLGLDCNGTTMSGYVKIGGVWGLAGGGTLTATDSAISTAGAIGMFTDNAAARIDNFGGGPFSASPSESLFRTGGDLSGMGAPAGRFFGNPLARVMAHARLVTTSWRRSGSGLFVHTADLITVPASA